MQSSESYSKAQRLKVILFIQIAIKQWQLHLKKGNKAVKIFHDEHRILVLRRTRGCMYFIFLNIVRLPLVLVKTDKYECEDE